MRKNCVQNSVRIHVEFSLAFHAYTDLSTQTHLHTLSYLHKHFKNIFHIHLLTHTLTYTHTSTVGFRKWIVLSGHGVYFNQSHFLTKFNIFPGIFENQFSIKCDVHGTSPTNFDPKIQNKWSLCKYHNIPHMLNWPKSTRIVANFWPPKISLIFIPRFGKIYSR